MDKSTLLSRLGRCSFAFFILAMIAPVEAGLLDALKEQVDNDIWGRSKNSVTIFGIFGVGVKTLYYMRRPESGSYSDPEYWFSFVFAVW